MSQTDKELSPFLQYEERVRRATADFTSHVEKAREQRSGAYAGFVPGERVKFSLHRDVTTTGTVERELPACGVCRVYVVRDHAGTTHKLAADKLGRVAR